MFNPRRGEATALNPSAAMAIKLCNDANNFSSLVDALEAARLGPANDDIVWLALGDLAALPVIETLRAPSAAAASSGTSFN
jgi:hypothetical protein